MNSKSTSFEVVRYLDHPLSRDQLEVIIDNLYDPIPDLVRKDRKFSELGLVATDYVTQDSVIDLLLQHPELMQRPLIQKNGKWSVARSQERVLEILRE